LRDSFRAKEIAGAIRDASRQAWNSRPYCGKHDCSKEILRLIVSETEVGKTVELGEQARKTAQTKTSTAQ
jgi:hypothetical protein